MTVSLTVAIQWPHRWVSREITGISGLLGFLSLPSVYQGLLKRRHGIFQTEHYKFMAYTCAHSPPLYSSKFKSPSLAANILTCFQKKLKKQLQAAATTYLHENKDIPALALILIRISKEMASCLPSQLGVQKLGALGFPQEAQRKAAERNRSKRGNATQQ